MTAWGRVPHRRVAAERLAAATDTSLLSARLSPLPDARLAAELGLDEADLRPAFVVRYPRWDGGSRLEMNEAGAALLQLFAAGGAWPR